jgi:polyhydroxyalkanoate synthase
MDPFGIIASFSRVQESWIDRSDEFQQTWLSLIRRLQDAALEDLRQALPQEKDLPDVPDAREAFLDAVKRQAVMIRKYHTIFSSWLKDLMERSRGLQEKDRLRAQFWARQLISALSPANFFWTNPVAVQKFLDSYGKSLFSGLENWWEDACERDFLTRIVDESAYEVGKNIASTPGSIVFRNDLMELIQYDPATEAVYALPVVFVPPWINKYYIFDLSPESSFVRYMRDQGFTVFIISWRNPSLSMRGVTFDDYMIQGARQAVEAARQICRAAAVHAAGYCIGGTALAALMAWFNRTPGRKTPIPVASWSLFSSLVDFSEPGDLGVFISSTAIEAVEALMQQDGFLDKKFISLAFRLLGADSLIWRNFTQNYLYGSGPPKSDMLFWNTDGTRLPEAMCSFYLREFYLKNLLAEKDGVTLAGRPIDLGRIVQPLYVVGTQLDHICPWRGTFRTGRLVSGPVKYVLSSEGHITGIVNPPSEYSRRRYWAGDVTPQDEAGGWIEGHEERHGSWWGDWTEWLRSRSLPMRRPPATGSRKYPPLGKAPGSYVLET